MAALEHLPDLAILNALREHDYRRSGAASALGVMCGDLRQRVRQMNAAGMGIPLDQNFGVSTGKEYLPEPSEIRAHCERLKRTWTPYERWRRSGGQDGAPELATHQIRGTLAVTQAVEFD